MISQLVEKSNLGNWALIAGLVASIAVGQFQLKEVVGDVKAQNSVIQELRNEQNLDKLRFETINKEQTKFDNTLNTVNGTLQEVNTTLASLKATIETIKKGA